MPRKSTNISVLRWIHVLQLEFLQKVEWKSVVLRERETVESEAENVPNDIYTFKSLL